MNQWNQLEKELSSWKPRRPSESLRAGLFGVIPPKAAATGLLSEVNRAAWHWLAPAMAVFCLGVFVFGRNIGGLDQFSSHPAPTMMATSALSEPHLASYFASTHHSDNNTVQNSFEWTNSGSPLTPLPSMATTNALTP